jgi:hypothetical protein
MKNNIQDEINIIENFISKDQAESIYKKFDKIKIKAPDANIECALGFRDEFDIEENLNKIDIELYKIAHKIKELIETKFDKKVAIKNCVYVNMLTGGSNPEHTDMGGISHPDQKKVSDDHNFEYSGLLYLNENYEGGNLNFPEHGFKIVPKSGMLVFFHGHEQLKHEVTEVLRGERKNIVMFFGRPVDND